MKRLALIAACLALALPAAAQQPQTLSVHRLKDVRMLVPASVPRAMVIYVSDRPGWTPDDDTAVKALQDDGSAVLAVDLKSYAAELDASSGECLYVVGELTDLAQTAQRQLDIQTYLPPILVGRGEGATFAYAALADAPANTLGGAVAVDFSNRLTLRLPFCPGATATKTGDGAAYRYGFDRPLPEPATLLVSGTSVDEVAAEASHQSAVTVEALDSGAGPHPMVTAVAGLAAAIEPFGTLPAVDLPSPTPPRAVAVFVSGDGGWRDIDKTMGEWLSTQGIHVVGVDALHYFWSRRTPEELAADIASLIADADPQGDLPVLLLGYSFGADTIPFAYPLLPQALRDRTKVLGLLAPGRTTSFQVTIAGWLGIDDSGYDIPAAISKLPKPLVLCIYGKGDSDSSCPDPMLEDFSPIATEGGHHFDGDYVAIAETILERAGLLTEKTR